MRVSDAERSQIADTLSKHYADGRLDEAEFNERLQKAMSAKTRSDFNGLLIDLPPIVPATPPETKVRKRRGSFGLTLIAAILFAAVVTSWMWSWTWHIPWILIAIVLFVVWRRSRWGWHRHRHYGWHGHAPAPWHSQAPGQYPPPGPPDPSEQYSGPGYGRGRGWWV